LIRRALYDLKLRYGSEIQIYRLDSAATNYQTGVKTGTKTVIDIRHAVVLPTSEMRRFFASIAFITASKQFLAPGNQGFDQSSRGFIIEHHDLAEAGQVSFEFQPEDWIVYRGKRYEVEMIERLEFDSGWLIVGKELKGTPPEQIISMNASDSLSFGEAVVNGF
ncbi:MAG: hypothetical protein MN733_12215, partial [Nitrososphaera sp.]|nr:hypothetical protein [Nitrososphaera sp.]